MKTIFISLSFFYLLPVLLAAQPVIFANEYYHPGDVIEMVRCNPAGAGAAGAGVTWDFSSLSPSGGLYTTTVATDTSTTFITSNLMITTSDGSITYEDENSTDSYINGVTNAANTTTTYNNYDIAKRPFTYNTTYLDSYKVDAPTVPIVGAGSIRETGDAYGTLMLPTGTYSNVLRIREYQVETDTISGGPSIQYTISYLWFDTIHNAPLFRMDSVVSVSGNTQTAMYLSTTTGVADISGSQTIYNGYLHNNTLLVTGGFEYGKTYQVVVYNIIGTKIFSDEFTAYGNSQQFDMDRQVIPGIYIVNITQKNDPSNIETIKVVNQ